MKDSIEAQSKLEGCSVSRLPTFDATTSQLLKGSVDFLGLNYYTSEQVTGRKEGENSETNSPGWNRDLGTTRVRDTSGRMCGVWWQRDVPTGLRHTLHWIKAQYGNPPVIITENGMASCDQGAVDDEDRVTYFRGHINETLKAVRVDGCNVQGYLGKANFFCSDATS